MAVKNLFRDVLRIITPEEVAVLTDTVTGRQKIHLKLIVQEHLGLVAPAAEITEKKSVSAPVVEIPVVEIKETEAKIIPFKKAVETPEVPPQDPPQSIELPEAKKEENLVELNEDGTVKFKEEEVVVEEKVDMTEFILSEKEKCRKVSKNMKKKEVLDLYNHNATIDLNRERALRSDPTKSANDGILINKKQA